MKAALFPLLWCLSLIFRGATSTRTLFYRLGILRRERLPGKTWSVGNIAVGGTGKSPITISLAQLLISEGRRPVILTRGYGSPIARGDSMVLRAGQVITCANSTSVVPDEARMQSAKLPTVPVVAGPDRVKAARDFLRNHPDYQPTHWLLDDGFQHLRLERDLDIVLLDGKNPFPNVMPLGRAREPGKSLKRANCIIFTRAGDKIPSANNLKLASKFTTAGTPILKTYMKTSPPTQNVDSSVSFDPSLHKPVVLVCGIAEPKQLLDAIRSMNIDISDHLSLGDHESIPKDALLSLISNKKSLLTTAKDYWRDPNLFESLPVPVFILDLEISWDQLNLRETLRDYL